MYFYPDVWGAKTVEQLIKEQKENNLRVYKTITDYTPFVKDKNASSYIGPKIAQVEAQTLPIDDADFTDPSRTYMQIFFNQSKGAAFLIEDAVKAQSHLNLLNIYTENAKESLIQAYEAFITENLVLSAPASGNRLLMTDSSENVLTIADIKNARKKLNAAGAPAHGRFMLVGPELEAQLWDIEQFVSAEEMGKPVIPDGVIGKILGFTVINYNAMPLVDSNGVFTGTCDKNAAVFYQRLAYGFARKKELGVKMESKAGLAGDYLNIYSIFGGAAQESSFIVTVREN